VITTVVSDFGGVLTSPLWEGFQVVQEQLDIPPKALGKAMEAARESLGFHPLYALERGEMTEAAFLGALEDAMADDLGRRVALSEFTAVYWGSLRANQPMIDRLAVLGGLGYRMWLLTNNVREWEPRWKAMLPIDDIFEDVVDSAFVGCRKPEPEIYALTVARAGVEPEECVLIDDFEVNCDAAREAGWAAVQFHDTAQAMGELDALLVERGALGVP
jgi:putative hydrolase of the HAD superfamily